MIIPVTSLWVTAEL